jgi:SOS response regulatory protein OraA/RecX
LDECLDSETESSRAICEAQKALKTMRPPYDRAVLLRLRGRLARRGFSSEIINQAIREINLPDLDAEGLD